MTVLMKVFGGFLLAGMLIAVAHCETLAVIDSMIISAQNADFPHDSTIGFYITEIYKTDDAIYVICDQNIIARYGKEDRWHIVAGREEYLAFLGDKISPAQKESAKFYPSQIWKLPSGELGLYDLWAGRVYSLSPSAPQGKRLGLLKECDEDLAISAINVQRDILLGGFYFSPHNRMVCLLTSEFSKCRRICELPAGLRHYLDSVGADYYPIPALDPNDSTIWVSFRHYNVIYIANLKGGVMDSVLINGNDFILPQPPASRIHSRAVSDDWYSKCSSIFSFQFVPPGYFLLQYSSPGKHITDTRPVHTLCWNSNHELVNLAINSRWRLKQVQSDGCLPFVAYDYEERVVTKAVIYLTRIMP
jgi:hypothetical protein